MKNKVEWEKRCEKSLCLWKREEDALYVRERGGVGKVRKVD